MSSFDQQNFAPDPTRRSFVLEKIPAFAGMMGVLPDVIKSSLRRAFVPQIPNDFEEPTPLPPTSEDEFVSRTRAQRIEKFIVTELSYGFFLSSRSGLNPLPEKLPNEQTNNLLTYAGYTNPQFLNIVEAQTIYKGKSNEHLRALGITANFTDLLSMLMERYTEIFEKGLVASLVDTIDPSVSDFERLTEKYSKLTGIPQDIIKTIWWRENFGIGNAPELHGGKHLPSGDGPLAPFVHLYSMPLIPQGIFQYSARSKQFARTFRTQPGEFVKTLAIMGDNRLIGRRDENIITTPIRTDLVQYDAELNIITGLILYYQALESVFSDPIINKASQHAMDQDPDLDYWSIAYSVYHHGPVPVQARQKTWGSQPFNYESLDWEEYFIDPARAASNTRKYKPWEQSRFIRKSGFPDDPTDLEFFDIFDFFDRWNEVVKADLEFEKLYSEFLQMVQQTTLLSKEEAGIGCLMLMSNASVIDFIETEMDLVIETEADQQTAREFIAFCRQIEAVLSNNEVDFGSFSHLGNVSDPEQKAKLATNSPLYRRLVLEFGYYLSERSFFSRMSNMFFALLRAIVPGATGSRSGSQPDIGTDIIPSISVNDMQTYQQLSEVLSFALTAESQPKNQADYYEEFVNQHPEFIKKYEPYQKMKASHEYRFGEAVSRMMIISIVAADEAATKFALDSILRLYGSKELVSIVEKILLEFRETNSLNNGFYYQLSREESDSQLEKRMRNNPLYRRLLAIVEYPNIKIRDREALYLLSQLLYGIVFPKLNDQFITLADFDWYTEEFVVERLTDSNLELIVQKLIINQASQTNR